MLTKCCQLHGLALHCCVPHMRHANRYEQINAIVLLQDRKSGVLVSIGGLLSWLVSGIELKLEPSARKELRNASKIRQGERGLHSPERYERLDIGLEYRTLAPGAE
jgi:hypothetical protein